MSEAQRLKRHKLRFMAGISASLLLSFSIESTAQLEEIVVTAQKREQSLQDVPISINAITGDALDDFGVRNTDDIIKLYPNLSKNQSSSYNSGFAIRGVGTDNFHISGQQSVGTYIDDVSAVSPFVSQIGVFDIDRIEVLRGPQNTLYGRNTTAGAVNYNTKKAEVGAEANGYARLESGEGGRFGLEGAYGFSVTDSLALRFAGMASEYEGHWVNLVDGDKIGGHEQDGYRISLAWEPSDDTGVHFSFASAERDSDRGVTSYLGNLNADGSGPCPVYDQGESAAMSRNECTATLAQFQLDASDFLTQEFNRGNTDLIRVNPSNPNNYLVNYSANWGETYQIREGVNHSEFDNSILRIEHDFSSFALTSITGYSEMEVQGYNPSDLHTFASSQDAEWEVFQQEIRLASTSDAALQWIAGVYYTSEDVIADTWVITNTFPPLAMAGEGVSPAILIDSEYEAISAYAQFDYELSEQWSLTAGVRYTDDSLEATRFEKNACTANGRTIGGNLIFPGDAAFDTGDITIESAIAYDRAFREANCTDISSVPPGPGPLGGLINPDSLPSQDLTETAYKLGINWSPGGSSLIYASFANGFKGGAFDNRALADGAEPIGPEFLDAWEIGFKTEFADNTVQVNGSIYFYTWEDQQVFEAAMGTPRQVNVPESELQGAEIEVKWAPNEAFFAQAGLGFTDSEITDATGSLTASDGNEITFAPDVTANILAVYTISGEHGDTSIQGDYRYVGKQFSEISNIDRSEFDARDYLNIRLAYNFGDERQYEIALRGTNLTEERAYGRLGRTAQAGHWDIGTQGFREWTLFLRADF